MTNKINRERDVEKINNALFWRNDLEGMISGLIQCQAISEFIEIRLRMKGSPFLDLWIEFSIAETMYDHLI